MPRPLLRYKKCGGLVLQFDHGDEYARYGDHSRDDPDKTGFKEFIRFINEVNAVFIMLLHFLLFFGSIHSYLTFCTKRGDKLPCIN